jgi:hypothetical protein
LQAHGGGELGENKDRDGEVLRLIIGGQVLSGKSVKGSRNIRVAEVVHDAVDRTYRESVRKVN